MVQLKLRQHYYPEEDLGQDEQLKKGMATHSNILAWEIPWTEGFGEL